MRPNDKGAFCFSCQKNVIDFSNKTLVQIKKFFTKMPDSESVCARFDERQLDALSFDDFFNQYLNWKRFQKAALIVFFVFGSSLFTSAQTVKGSPRIKTDAVTCLNKDTAKVKPKKENRDESLILGKVKREQEILKKKEHRRTTMGAPKIQRNKTK
jgi:hypothetical protein